MAQLELPAAVTSSVADSDVLSDRRRREVLAVLRGADRPLALADLAADLVRRERDGTPEGPDYEAIRRCRLALHHKHVPKLVEAGLVRYDPELRTADYRDTGRAGAWSDAVENREVGP